jgi:hypothetical protein
MFESKHSPFSRRFRWPIAKRRGSAGIASRELTACMKEELSNGRHGKESHSVPREVDNQPGMLANTLHPFSEAGADLQQVVMAYPSGVFTQPSAIPGDRPPSFGLTVRERPTSDRQS